MLVYKICGKDGPSSTNPDCSPCPYCDADAPECLNYNPEARPYTKAPCSLPHTVPIQQHAVDMAQGAVHVLYTVELPLVEDVLVNNCGMPRATWDNWYTLVGPDRYVLGGGVQDEEEDEFDTTLTDYLQRSITNTIGFFQNAKYLDIIRLAKFWVRSDNTRDYNGRQFNVLDLLSAMLEHTATIARVAYTRKPKVHDIMAFKSAATHLRSILCVLNAKTTIWGHGWTWHAAQFLIHWGILYPILCHGLEGRWRDLKIEIKLSTHGQWKGAVVGFEQVLKYSIVAWAILRLGMSLVGRTRHVTKLRPNRLSLF